MQQFKKFLTGTEGEKIWQCIQDVMDYCQQNVSDKIKRYDLHHLIMKYLANGTLYELSSRMKLYLFLGKLHKILMFKFQFCFLHEKL